MQADSPIRTIQDLKGKTVAVNRGSGSHFVLAASLKRAGLGFSDIRAAYMPPADSVAGVRTPRCRCAVHMGPPFSP